MSETTQSRFSARSIAGTLILLLLSAASLSGPGGGSSGGMLYAESGASPVEGEKGSEPAEPSTAASTRATTGGLAPEDARLLEQLRQQDVRERSLFEVLEKRRTELDERERRLEKESEQLLLLRASLEEKIAELKSLQTQVDEMLKRAETQKSRELKNLVGVYESMKPQEAAEILQQMDEPMALQIVAGMSTESVSKILATMDKVKAAEFSKRLVTVPGRP